MYTNSIRKGTNQTKIKHTRQKNRQSIRKGKMQLTHNTITIFTTKNYREKHNIINCEE